MSTSKSISFADRFDLLRYPLIAFVVLIHADNREICLNGNCIPMDLHGAFPLWMRDIISQVWARVAVPLFFAISGYLFFLGYDGSLRELLRKWKSRVFTLLLPFLVWGLLHMSIRIYGKGFQALGVDFWGFWDMIFGITRAPLVYHFWFIRDLIFYVLAAPLIYLLIHRAWWIGLCLCGYVYFCHAWFFPRPNPEGLFYFVLGAILGLNAWQGRLLDRFRWIWICGYAILGLADSLDKGHVWSEALHKAGMLVGCGAFLALAGIVRASYPTLTKRLVYLGSASFFLYALHEPLLRQLRSWMYGVLPLGFDPSGLFLYLIPTLLVTATVTALYFGLVRRFSLLRKGLAGGR